MHTDNQDSKQMDMQAQDMQIQSEDQYSSDEDYEEEIEDPYYEDIAEVPSYADYSKFVSTESFNPEELNLLNWMVNKEKKQTWTDAFTGYLPDESKTALVTALILSHPSSSPTLLTTLLIVHTSLVDHWKEQLCAASLSILVYTKPDQQNELINQQIYDVIITTRPVTFDKEFGLHKHKFYRVILDYPGDLFFYHRTDSLYTWFLPPISQEFNYF